MVKLFRLNFCSVALTVALSTAGCTQTASTSQQSETPAPAPSSDLPQVVATSTVLCDLTKQIAQETVAVTCLMQPNQDPHVYTPIPSDRKTIEDADLVLYGGYNYESSLIKIIQADQTTAAKVAVYEVAVPEPLMGEAHEHGEEAAADHDHEAESATAADHDHEETVDQPDPHVWHSARNGAEIVTVIGDSLAKLVPDQASLYQQNANTLSQQFAQIDDWIKTQVATVPTANRKLVTTHEALAYYADTYGFELEGTIEGVSTEEKPSAARLTGLVDQLKQAKVPTIFVENTTNPKLLETVAQEANVKVAQQPLYIEGPGGEDTPAPTYQTMLISNTCTVVEGLGGQCDRATAPVEGP